jgi:predicted nucleic acid-binding protein
MTLVLDASAAVAITLATPGAELFTESLEQATAVLAPDLFTAEVCNAFWKYRRADLLTMERCEQALEHALALPDLLEASSTLHREAFTLAVRHNHPVYDALYLVLARRNNATLLTLDKRLTNLAYDLEIQVISPQRFNLNPGGGR